MGLLAVLVLALVLGDGVANLDPQPQEWAGTLSGAAGRSITAPLIAALAIPAPLGTPATGRGRIEWAGAGGAQEGRGGVQCVDYTGLDLEWSVSPSGAFSASTPEEGDGPFAYALDGAVDGAGSSITGDITRWPRLRRHHRLRHRPEVFGRFALRLSTATPPRCAPAPTARTAAAPNISAVQMVWPLPASVETGSTAVWVDAASFRFVAGGSASPAPALAAAFARQLPVCFPHRTHATTHATRRAGPLLTSLVVHVADASETVPRLGVDESYNLTIGANASAVVHASTLFGAYHALESFSQLLVFDFGARGYRINGTPLAIVDRPRFGWRELMVDTARHFQPLPVLERVVDAMAMAKLNVLHVHWVDSQAFPLVLPSPAAHPLSKGAHSPQERYTLDDVAQLQAYAAARGVRVVAEVDTPGHAASWCVGRPDVCPDAVACPEPLDPSNNATFEAIGAVLAGLAAVLPDGFLHLGGDEVDTACWTKSAAISRWMADRGWTPAQTYNYFTARTQGLVSALGKQAIVWDEVYHANGPSGLDPSKVVINTRFNAAQAPARVMVVANATAHGFRVVRSQNIHWYLDQTLHKPWTAQYNFEPCTGLNATQCALIVGGAASMWGETVDVSDLQQTVWPRAGAVAERLWSPRAVNDSTAALPRYSAFRCLLNRRGIPAAPALNPVARSAPHGPGSCFAQ